MSQSLLLENLMKWLRTFETASDVHFVSEIADGRILGNVLSTISPKHFSSEWLAQLYKDEPEDWTMKVNNLRHILQAIISFYAEVPDERIAIDPEPDLVAVARDECEVATIHLLQLVLGCAVNCETKETYIETIMCMEESVQQSLMEAIQQLMCPRSSMLSETYPELVEQRLVKALDQCKTLLTENANLAAKCQELEIELNTLRDEKHALELATEKLRHTTLTEADSLSGTVLLASPAIPGDPVAAASLSPTVANVRIGQLQDQVSKLRTEIYRLETAKEEVDLKLTHTTEMNEKLKQKCDQLSKRAEEAAHLKDELDIAREELASTANLTTQLEQLRKRADEAVELRVRCAKLTEDNRICVERLRELEQESRFSGNLRSQAETQRMQAADARLEANEAMRRADAMETELRKVREELTATVREKMLLVTELNRLRACCEELQMCVNPSHGVEEEFSLLAGDSNVQLSPAIQSHMLNLQEELSRLRTSLSSVDVHSSTMVDAESVSRSTTQGLQTEPVSVPSPSKPDASVKLENGLDKANSGTSLEENDLSSIRRQLEQKELDMAALEQRYRGYLWKAREVIRLLEREQRILRDRAGRTSVPKSSPDSNETTDQEIERLRELLVEKENIIEKLELHHEQSRRHRDVEERILVSAWYNLFGRFTRESVEGRLQGRTQSSLARENEDFTNRVNNTHPLSSDHAVSFLERQRELHLKPPRGLTSVVVASK